MAIHGWPSIDGNSWMAIHGWPSGDGHPWMAIHGCPSMDGHPWMAIHGSPIAYNNFPRTGLVTNYGLHDFTHKAAGGSSAYANEFRTNLEASVTTVLMTSVVAKGNFRFSGEEMMSHYLENFLQTQTPERIEKFFVSEFGTHYIVSGSVGGRVQSKATMSDCVQRQFVKQDIEAAADFEVQKGEIKTKAPAERFWRLEILQKAPAERF